MCQITVTGVSAVYSGPVIVAAAVAGTVTDCEAELGRALIKVKLVVDGEAHEGETTLAGPTGEWAIVFKGVDVECDQQVEVSAACGSLENADCMVSDLSFNIDCSACPSIEVTPPVYGVCDPDARMPITIAVRSVSPITNANVLWLYGAGRTSVSELVDNSTQTTLLLSASDFAASLEVVVKLRPGCFYVVPIEDRRCCPAKPRITILDTAGQPVDTTACVNPGTYTARGSGAGFADATKEWKVDSVVRGSADSIVVVVPDDELIELFISVPGCPNQDANVRLVGCTVPGPTPTPTPATPTPTPAPRPGWCDTVVPNCRSKEFRWVALALVVDILVVLGVSALSQNIVLGMVEAMLGALAKEIAAILAAATAPTVVLEVLTFIAAVISVLLDALASIAVVLSILGVAVLFLAFLFFIWLWIEFIPWLICCDDLCRRIRAFYWLALWTSIINVVLPLLLFISLAPMVSLLLTVPLLAIFSAAKDRENCGPVDPWMWPADQ